MTDTVIDSSVVAKWVLPETDSALAQKVFIDVTGGGGKLLVLDLALAEVANAIWKRVHCRLITVGEARAFLEVLVRMPIDLQPAAAILAPALEIASTHDRSNYDALFVALANQTGLKAVTADEPLFNAVHDEFPEIVLLRNW